MVVGMSKPASIPWTKIASRYKDLETDQASRLRKVACDLANPEAFIADLAESAAEFASYANIDEPFYDPKKRRPLPDPASVHDLGNGRAVMAKVAAEGTCQVVGARYSYQYVDYELVPTRTTPGTITFDDGVTWRSALRLDLLLASNKGAPVAAEIKARSDKDPYFALVQALAHAVHLGTPSQLERLRRWYPDHVFSGKRVDVAVILSERPERGNYLELLLHGAQLLADALLQDKRVTRHIGAIHFVEARLAADRGLSLTRIPVPPLRKVRKTIESWEGDLAKRFPADHPLLTTNSRDIHWFRDAAKALDIGS